MNICQWPYFCVCTNKPMNQRSLRICITPRTCCEYGWFGDVFSLDVACTEMLQAGQCSFSSKATIAATMIQYDKMELSLGMFCIEKSYRFLQYDILWFGFSHVPTIQSPVPFLQRRGHIELHVSVELCNHAVRRIMSCLRPLKYLAYEQQLLVEIEQLSEANVEGYQCYFWWSMEYVFVIGVWSNYATTIIYIYIYYINIPLAWLTLTNKGYLNETCVFVMTYIILYFKRIQVSPT